MAENAGIKRMSFRHDAIAELMIANPTLSKTEIAAYFGVALSTLSRVINSDIFVAYYTRLRGDYVETRVMPIRDKLHGLAHQVIDKLATKMESIDDARLLKDVMDSTLSNLGYGAPKSGGVVVNVQTGSITAEELEAARARYRDHQRALTNQLIEAPALEHNAGTSAPG